MEGKKIRFYLNFIFGLAKSCSLWKILSLSNVPGNAVSDRKTLPSVTLPFLERPKNYSAYS